MDIVQCRNEANDNATIDRNRDVMAWIREKFSSKIRIDRIVEYIGCDARQNVRVFSTKDPDFRAQTSAEVTRRAPRPVTSLKNASAASGSNASIASVTMSTGLPVASKPSAANRTQISVTTPYTT